MIRSPLQEPGEAGTYDAETSLAGLDFGAEHLTSFFEPTERNWRQLMAAYHEWIHHYQYHATSYGYLARHVSNAQLLLVNGVLRLTRETGHRVPLPLAQRMTPLTESLDHPVDVNLRLITMLHELRDGILGFGPHIDMSAMQEWLIACRVLGDQFGGPRAIVLEPTYMPTPPTIRYPVRDLLETHAHVLSALWLMLAVDRIDGDRRIMTAAADHANAQLVGPYAAFTPFASGLPGDDANRMKLFCGLAEIALSPPGIHRHPRMSTETMITPLHTSWFPVVRMETLMADALNAAIEMPDPGWPDCGRLLIDSVIRAQEQRGSVPGAFLPIADGAVAQPALERVVQRVARYAAVDDDVPPPLLSFQLDGLAKLCVAEELRQDVPLMLAGFVIEELRLLVSRVGGPTTISHVDGRKQTLVGNCMGLLHLGLLSPATLQAGSDAVVTAGGPIAFVLQQLLRHSRAELEAIADQPVFGANPWTLRSVLAEHYDVALSDFD